MKNTHLGGRQGGPGPAAARLGQLLAGRKAAKVQRRLGICKPLTKESGEQRPQVAYI